jgi:hypothetical protein
VSLKYPRSFLVPFPGNSCCIYLCTQWSLYLLSFFISTFTPFIMDQTTILSFFAPKGKFFEPSSSEHPILTFGYEFPSDLITKVQELSFSRLSSDNPYHHLWEFEKLCSCIAIASMSHDTLEWKLFPFSCREG